MIACGLSLIINHGEGTTMFELNLACLPNSILYLEGVQLSYIKVFVQIFNLWHSGKPCFITNTEFCNRTSLHRDTVIQAINFFERHKVLKRVQKGTKRYLVQTEKSIQVESHNVDKSSKNSSNSAQGSELDDGGVGVRRLKGSELDDHNIKYNNKFKKSSYKNDVHKKTKPSGLKTDPVEPVGQNGRTVQIENSKKHDFADSMNQMANEKRHIEEHEQRKQEEKWAPMPDNIREIIKGLKNGLRP